MAKVSEFFDSKHLAAADLGGREHKLTIERSDFAEFKDGNKPVLFFQGRKKGMVLNKTNASKLRNQYGDEMNDWAGKEVIIYPDTVDFQGQMVACIRLRPVLPTAAAGEFDNDGPNW